jgi:hypothetical protein
MTRPCVAGRTYMGDVACAVHGGSWPCQAARNGDHGRDCCTNVTPYLDSRYQLACANCEKPLEAVWHGSDAEVPPRRLHSSLAGSGEPLEFP